MTPLLLVVGPRADDVRRIGEGLERLGFGTDRSTPSGNVSDGEAESFHQLNRRLLRLFSLSPEAGIPADSLSMPPSLAEWFKREAQRLIPRDQTGVAMLPSAELAPTLQFWREALRPAVCLFVIRGGSPSVAESAPSESIAFDPEAGESAARDRLRVLAARLNLGDKVIDGLATESGAGALRSMLDSATGKPELSPSEQRVRDLFESLAEQEASGIAPAGAAGGPAAFDWGAALDMARESGVLAGSYTQSLKMALDEQQRRLRLLRSEVARQARGLSRQPRQLRRLKQREQGLDNQLKMERAWRLELRRDPAFRFFSRLPGRGRWLADPGMDSADGHAGPSLPAVQRHSKKRDLAKLETGLQALRRAVWTEPWPWPIDEEDLRLAPSPREVGSWLELRDKIRVRPLFSVLTPVHRVQPAFLRAALQSVFDQVYDHWELCLAVDEAVSPECRDLIEAFRARFPDRIKVNTVEKTPGIAVSTNSAADAARGDFVVFLDHDDRLTPDALLVTARYLEQEPETDLIYSDEDCLDEQGVRGLALRKPGFSPELLLSCNYIVHMVGIRKTLFDRIGRLREGFEYSQDYDLLLRATESARRVGHLPRILYHWRMHEASSTHEPLIRKRHSRESSRRALQDAVSRRGWNARVERSGERDAYRVRFAVDPDAAVSIIVADAEDAESLRACIRSVHLKTSHPKYEVVVVTSGAGDGAMVEFVTHAEKQGKLRRVVYEGQGGVAARNNAGARDCDSPYFLFLSAKTEVLDPDWLTALLEHAQRPEIGAVGAQFLSHGSVVRQAGIYVGRHGKPGFAFRNLPADYLGSFGTNQNVRNCLAVSDACMMVRRDPFLETRGFDEAFANRHQDVDLCLRLIGAGHRIVYTPFARLALDDNGGEDPDESAAMIARRNGDLELLHSRWNDAQLQDPWFLPDMDAGEELSRLFEPKSGDDPVSNS